MKLIKLGIILLIVLGGLQSQAQKSMTSGQISYISSKNIYVKFASTRDFNIGDTLYIQKGDNNIPALKIIQKSSISCVCSPLVSDNFEIGQQLIHQSTKPIETAPEPEELATVPLKKEEKSKDISPIEASAKSDKGKGSTPAKINGRFASSAYTNFSNDNPISDPRLRYTLSLRGENLTATNLNFSSYISFRHKLNHWNEIQENIFSGLKIYDLALNKSFKSFDLTIGRKINRTVSNIGAIDGMQLGYHFDNITFGAILGTRPDHRDYSLNFNLPEAGIYVAHVFEGNTGSVKNTLGIFEQRVGSLTDRRYLYFQHTNTLVKKLYVFGSFQLDLFEVIEESPKSDLRMTSLYFSVRYRFSKKIDMFASYDNRKNIVYYETYKNALDQLIDQATRQGFRLRFIFRPIKYTTAGISGTYRFENGGLGATKNLHAYVNYARVPFLKMSSALSYTFLDNYYLNSHIFGLRLNKDFQKGKIGTSLNYRYVNYIYDMNQVHLRQHIAGINVNWRIFYELSLSLNHEISFSGDNMYHRSYIKLIKRIKQ